MREGQSRTISLLLLALINMRKNQFTLGRGNLSTRIASARRLCGNYRVGADCRETSNVGLFAEALTALAEARSKKVKLNYQQACWKILVAVDSRGVEPSSYTFAAFVNAYCDGPQDAVTALGILQNRNHPRPWPEGIWEAAIYSCARSRADWEKAQKFYDELIWHCSKTVALKHLPLGFTWLC